jgi:hypothetical protein
VNIDLKNGIVLAIIAASFGVIGFFGAQHFQAENKKVEYRLKLTEKLYEKNSKSTRVLVDSISGFIKIFGDDFGLSSKEIVPALEKFNTALKVYEDHVLELKRLATTEQIEAAKRILDWSYSFKFTFQLQHDSAVNIENRAYELLKINKQDNEDAFDFVNKALENELENLIRMENRIYYSEGIYKLSVIRGLEQYLNYYFRFEMGLEATLDMSKSINKLPETIKNSNEFKFSKKVYPYSFAAHRKMFAPELDMSNMGEIMADKDVYLREQVKLEFLRKVIDSHDHLKKKYQAEVSKKTNKAIKSDS